MIIDWDYLIPPIKEIKILSSRTITFLAVAALIVAAVFATISMINLPRPVVEQPMAASNAQGLAQYHQSERAGYTKEAGLAQYHRSEWGLNVHQAAGLAIYHRSEHGFPIRDLSSFNAYQRSEWFGQ